jgi:erythromycin esterase-like protein
VRNADLIDVIRRRSLPISGPISGKRNKLRSLVQKLGTAQVVLLGEATHGTHEFYRLRAEITQRLIAEHGFSAVAVEADWPDAYRVNRYVRGVSDDKDGVASLGAFQRFPTWMWRNADVVPFVDWLREFNQARSSELHVGFYGLDLYSLHSSMRQVLTYLDSVDPEAAYRARVRYSCFDRFGGEPQSYGYAATVGMSPSCEREVLAQLTDLQQRGADYIRKDGYTASADEFFFAEQNARLVANAEEYYRTMFLGRIESWNVRDQHMDETLVELMAFLRKNKREPKVVVWAHNSHLGDARATEMGGHGELNLGQLARERFESDAMLVGFTTHSGTVTAASSWDGPAETKEIVPSLPASYERLFHETGLPSFLAPLRTDEELSAALISGRLERAIGVIYVPETERNSHYFHARLSDQFDYVIHIDETTAVKPLEQVQSTVREDELEDTYPSGL